MASTIFICIIIGFLAIIAFYIIATLIGLFSIGFPIWLICQAGTHPLFILGMPWYELIADIFIFGTIFLIARAIIRTVRQRIARSKSK